MPETRYQPLPIIISGGENYMFSKKIALLLVVAVVMGLIAACGGAAPQPETVTVVETVVVEKVVEGETKTVVETVEVVKEVEKVVEVAPEDPDANRVRLDAVIGTEPPSLDPALGTDTTSIFFIRQMFMGLAGFDQDANVVPELATDWDVSDDGLVWTFHMRDDVQWVHRDPNTGEYEAIRPVTAQDVEYGVKRTLNPNTASDYAYVLYVIDGAEAFNTADPNAEDFADIESAVGVKALDDTTVQFTLGVPAAYFPSIAAMWVTYPQPQEAIDQWGDNWTEAGLIVTNGPYTLREWNHGSDITIEKNPLWVNADDVQIELFGGPIIQEASTAMALYENNEIDMMADPGWGPPLPDMDRINADPQLSQELFIAPRTCTYYYGFVNSKPPFDDPLVRKAFAAAIDRQSLIDNVVKGGQIPAHSFAPPGIFGNVADDMGIGGFLVESSYADQVKQAQEWLAEAGYPDGEGLDVLLMHNTSEAHAQIAQAVQAMWQEAFPKANITIENQEWAVYLKTLLPDSPVEEKPNVYRLGWCADYPDENNWVNEVFNSKSGQNYATYNNPEFDKLVEEAAIEPDPAKRKELYKQAEDIFIDQDTAIAPIYYYTYVRMYKPWVTPVIRPVSGDPIAQWKIDWDAKMAARGN
ncbi:MAG: peptide ABC transporter substrate-binding protein [Chloroflexi bacterium]|nr:MAG: peptide ABC transporter substrate-binding protein [Chloroflexota bacterium]